MSFIGKIKMWLKTKVAFPVIAIAGLVLMFLIVKLQPDMKHNPVTSLITPVNYIKVVSHLIKPEIIGYGVVKPDMTLQAKAEVSGRVTYIHPKLKKGEIFSQGTLLLTIDDKDYLLQLKQAQADLLVNKANLQEMTLTIENNELERLLALEKLQVRNAEYARMLKLSKTGVVSKSSLNGEKQNLLKQKQEVQQLENKKTILPSTLAVMKAQLEISKAKLEKSQRDLARTQIPMPFNGRISEVYTELNQYVSAGGLSSSGQLFDAFTLNKVIINAQFPLEQFRLFAQNFNKDAFENKQQAPNMKDVLQSLGLTVMVQDPRGLFKAWPATVERFSDNLDAKSRTVGIMVSVSDSYKEVLPGTRPPLLEGMYMKVILAGKPKNMLILPRFALHNKQVFIIDEMNLLQRVDLDKLQYHGDLLLVDSTKEQTIKANDKVIISDVFPAVNGMEVTPILDDIVTKQMMLWLGEESTPTLSSHASSPPTSNAGAK
ncbi:efflux RND transporter periplasmic adaptor subunit [Candidatus Colwellia aromaticivorans]|uniref:efflux RND transporter periplasmic adaptor subunit n=1 Tax=Candidatus Colwellia aromaticivorans TaxID=2267621 RepID=UPI000DF32D7F|nr:biotin/lipoyl-binding protein [Candidatus Colwellia aromaticivorans]